MSEIIIHGKCPDYIQREEVRAIVLGTISVMAFHGYFLKRPQLPVVISMSKRKNFGQNKLNPDSKTVGVAWRGLGKFKICSTIRSKASFTTVLIHETIHLCASWGDSDEFIVSTLTDRLKESIIEVANGLAANTYKRAAYFAHASMAYKRDEENDEYNDEQYANRITTNGTACRSSEVVA